jgi:hypothetical protein
MTNAPDDHPRGDAPSSGSFEDPSTDSGTAAGDALAGVDSPEEPPAYPDGSDETFEG